MFIKYFSVQLCIFSKIIFPAKSCFTLHLWLIFAIGLSYKLGYYIVSYLKNKKNNTFSLILTLKIALLHHHN
uniref:Uncharacterized protein n=1 Tax=Phlebotomus kandelakii TaxID=1109342 RepID=A0A6B2EJC2_9DIPT